MNKRLVYHIAFWIAYVLFKTFQNIGTETRPNEFASMEAFLGIVEGQVALLLVKVPMVYTLFYIADKFLSKQWKVIKVIASILLLYTVALTAMVLVIKLIVMDHIYKIPITFATYIHLNSILYNTFILTFACSIAMAIKLVRLYIYQKRIEQEMTKKKLETELRFLKSQTNPHFLFNTLNNIYALARKDAAPEAVLKLSKLLRFMLYESQNKSIPIADELKVIDSYIELEKIRYNERLEVIYKTDIDDTTQAIAPLILLPFIENAFKHGASETRFNSYIHIEIKSVAGHLDFMVENSSSFSGTGGHNKKIGLVNVSRQLELMYPEHKLIIENETDRFKVSLYINLQVHANI
jgi:two-component system LytT family sensor kinase